MRAEKLYIHRAGVLNIRVYIMEYDISPWIIVLASKVHDTSERPGLGLRNVKMNEEGYSIPPRTTAPTPAARVSSHLVESRNPTGAAALTVGPVRFEAAELPQSWKLRKYAFVSDEGAQDESLPP